MNHIDRLEMSDSGSLLMDVLSNGLILHQLQSRLCVAELLYLKCVSPACRQLVATLNDEMWTGAIRRSVPSSHHLAKARDIHSAIAQHCATQQAIRAQEMMTL